MLQTFGRVVSWSLFFAFFVAGVAWAVPKIWALSIDLTFWQATWLGGAVVAGLVAALAWTLLRGPSATEAATEIDRRFGLRERLTSSLTLSPADRETNAGQALIADAQRRASAIEVNESFKLQPARLGLLPLVPLGMLGLLLFIPDAVRDTEPDAAAALAARQEAEQVQRTAKVLKRKIQQARKQAKQKGLSDAEDLFNKMEKKLDDVAKRSDINRKNAMIEMNDLKQELKNRRDKLGSPDAMRKSLSNLDNMQKGPADRVAKAMQRGDFGDAKKAVDELARKLRDGKLSDQEKAQLAKQVEEMKQKLQEKVEQQEQAKKDLQQKIEQAKREGRNADADKLQQKLNEMEQQQQQCERMQRMAEGLQSAQQAMQDGDPQEAAEELEEMAEELGEMQQELDEMQDLEAAMDQLSDAKNQMRCQQCQGNGCQACQGQGLGQQPGNGLGEGPGFGERPEAEDDTNTYDTQVRAKLQKGRGVRSGIAGGKNKKGTTREEVQDAVFQAMSEASDPVENQALPRTEREHAQQYLDLLRESD